MYLFSIAVALLFGYSARIQGTGVSGFGWALGGQLYRLLEEVSGLLGFTRSYEVLLGWPFVVWLILWSLLFGALGWIVAEGVRSACLRVRKRISRPEP